MFLGVVSLDASAGFVAKQPAEEVGEECFHGSIHWRILRLEVRDDQSRQDDNHYDQENGHGFFRQGQSGW